MEWDLLELGDLAQFVNGRAFKPTEWSDDGLPIIRIQNLNSKAKSFNFFKGEYDNKHLILNNEILLSWSGTPGTSFGCFLWTRGKALLNQHIFKVILDLEKCDRDYFIRAVNKNLQLIIDDAHGGVGLKHITKKKLVQIKIPLPPLPIQKKIAAILDAADDYRQKTKALIERYDALTQSLFLDMFGDPVKNEKGWEIRRLADVTTKIQDGTHFSPELTPKGVPYITAKHIKKNRIEFFEKATYTSQESHEKIYKRCDVKKGDVIYIKDGATTGIAAVNEFEFEFSMLSSIALLRVNPKNLSNYYLSYLLNHEQFKDNLIRTKMTGAAIKRFTNSKINSFNIPIPNIILQEDFTNKVLSIEAQKQQAEISLVKADELFQSLLHRAFKGELVN